MFPQKCEQDWATLQGLGKSLQEQQWQYKNLSRRVFSHGGIRLAESRNCPPTTITICISNQIHAIAETPRKFRHISRLDRKRLDFMAFHLSHFQALDTYNC